MPSTTVEILGRDKTKKAFSSVSKSMDRLKSSMGGLKGAVAGLIGGAGLGALVTNLTDVADKLGKTSMRLGISTTDLQKFRFAAKQSGVETSTFDMALQRFTRRTAEAAEGTGVAKDALEKMGITIKNNDGTLKTNADLLREVADAFANTTDQSERVKLAFKLFDSEGVKMVNMLQQGSIAIDAMGNQLESVGGVIENDTVKAAEQFNDRLSIMAESAKGLLSPLIDLVNKGLDPFFEATERLAMPLKKQEALIQSQINSLVAQRNSVQDVVHVFEVFGKEIRIVTQEREKEVKKIQIQIDELAKVRNELREQIAEQNKLTEAKNRQIKVTQEENELRQQANNDQLLFNDLLAVQLQMYSEGLLMMEESAQKQREINEQKIIDFHREIDEFERMETAKQEMQEATARATISTMASMASAVKDEGVELFRFWQAAAVANTWMSTYEAAMKAWAQLGIFGGPAAAAIAILGAAQIGKILSTKPPGKQAGGDVRPGETYLVGEKGPELLTMGQYGGNVTPNRNLAQGVMINIYDGTGRKIDQAMSDLRVEVVERAQQFGEFAALESRQYTQNAFA